MDFEINGVIQIISGLFLLVSLLAAALATARASFAKTQIEALRGDRDDLQARVAILENENDRNKVALSAEHQKVLVLERVVTGKEQLEHIQSSIDNNHKANLEWQEKQAKVARDILGLLSSKRSDDGV